VGNLVVLSVGYAFEKDGEGKGGPFPRRFFDRERNMRTERKWIGKAALAAAVVAGLCLLSTPAKADNTAEATYKAKCAMCHGPDGKGESPMGKTLKVKDFASEEVQKTSDADLSGIIANGKGKMPAYKTMTPEQVKDLVGYIRAFAKKK
jgi:mono/diheme cytochrome c family protein